MTPFWGAGMFAMYGSIASYAIFSVLLTVLLNAYYIYFYGRWGASLGKMACRIKVVSEDGSPINYRQSFYRCFPYLLYSVLPLVAMFLSFSSLSEDAYSGLQTLEEKAAYLAPDLVFSIWLGFVSNGYCVVAIIVLLFNPRKRTIHDFIAGTMVVCLPEKN